MPQRRRYKKGGWQLNIISPFGLKTYREQFPARNIISYHHAFLPCRSFDVTVPVIVKKENMLNLFEYATLRLLHYQRYSLSELVDVLCMEQDFLSLILLRLQELQLIDLQNLPTDKGEQFLSFQEKKKEELDERCVTLYMNEATGQILSYVATDDTQKADRLLKLKGIHGSSVTFSLGGSAGKEKPEKGFLLKTHKFPPQPQPTPFAVRQCLLEFTGSSKELTAGEKHIQKSVISEYHCFVSESRPVLFHLQVAVQQGAVEDFLVSEGLYPTQPYLAEYVGGFPSFKREFLGESLQQMELEVQEQVVVSASALYPQVEILKRKMVLEEDASQDEKNTFYSKSTQNLQGIFSDVEWALHYYYQKNQLSPVVYQARTQQTAKENQVSLEELLKQLYIPLERKHQSLLGALDKGRMRRYEEKQVPQLSVLLPLILFQANEDMNSRIYTLKKNMPYFLRSLFELNEQGKVMRHDSSSHITPQDYDKFYYQSKQIIETLLGPLEAEAPLCENNDNQQAVPPQETTFNQSQLKINAVLSLEGELGHVLYRNLPNEIQQELQRISTDKQPEHLPVASGYLLVLSRICEYFLKNKLEQFTMQGEVSKRTVLKTLEEKGWKDLPNGLTKVGENFIQSGLKGKNSTLGGYTLAYLYHMPPEKVSDFTGYLDTIQQISEMRGHGNQMPSPPDLETLSQLRTEVMKLLRMEQ